MGLKRGDIVVVALSGDYGKPRPALVIQSDVFLNSSSVTILPLTSDLSEAAIVRILIEPAAENGLRKPSNLMVDKIQTVAREKAAKVIGRLNEETMFEVTQALALFLGFA